MKQRLARIGLVLMMTAIVSVAPAAKSNVQAEAPEQEQIENSTLYRLPVHEIYTKSHTVTKHADGISNQDSFFNSVYLEPPDPLSSSYYLTGDWGGYRTKLADAGVAVDLSYTNNLLGNPWGGAKQGFAYDDSTGLNLSFNLQKLVAMQGWTFYVQFVQRNGESLTGQYIYNQFPVSQIFGGQNFRMDSMYLKKSMLNDRLQLSFGRLNAGDYFLQSPLYYAYVSNAYCGNPIAVFFNVPFSAYPNAQWGTYLYGRITKILAAKAAVFNTNTSVSQNRFHGLNFSVNGNDGTMFITEWDLLNNKHLCLFGCNHPGRYTVGFMHYSGSGQNDQLTGLPVSGNYGFYYQLEQKWFQPGINALRGLSTFFVMELFPENYNKIPFFYDTGIIYRGISAKRPRDYISLGFAYGRYSRRLQQKEQLQNMPTQTYEENIELNYCIYLTKWFFLQPDIQYVIRPSGYTAIPNAWVFGAQMSLTF